MIALSDFPERRALYALLEALQTESHPRRLLDHLRALESLLTSCLSEEHAWMSHLYNEREVSGTFGRRFMDDCGHCMGDAVGVVRELRTIMTQFEHSTDQDPTPIHDASRRVSHHLEHHLMSYDRLSQRSATF